MEWISKIKESNNTRKKKVDYQIIPNRLERDEDGFLSPKKKVPKAKKLEVEPTPEYKTE